MSRRPKNIKGTKFIRLCVDFIVSKLSKMPTSELEEIKKICEKPAQNSEWWMEKDLKPVILKAVKNEIFNRNAIIKGEYIE